MSLLLLVVRNRTDDHIGVSCRLLGTILQRRRSQHISKSRAMMSKTDDWIEAERQYAVLYPNDATQNWHKLVEIWRHVIHGEVIEYRAIHGPLGGGMSQTIVGGGDE